jgi:hypothetical protein
MPRPVCLLLPLLLLAPIGSYGQAVSPGRNPVGEGPAGKGPAAGGSSRASAVRKPVSVSQDTIGAGQSVTLTWNFSGKKIVVSGGRFGAGVNVTGRLSVVDRPKKTTRYGFDVWYRAVSAAPSHRKAAARLQHAHYSLVVTVAAVQALTLYRDPRGWEIKHVAGWHTDIVATAAGGPRGLTYFQPEDDAVDRLVVAVLPMKGATCADLVEKIRADIPSHYENMTIVSESQCVYEGVPAVKTCFTGVDDAHPGTRTTAVFLALVEEDLAYVITVRTATVNFKARQTLMEQMLKSFHVRRGSAAGTSDLSMAQTPGSDAAGQNARRDRLARAEGAA